MINISIDNDKIKIIKIVWTKSLINTSINCFVSLYPKNSKQNKSEIGNVTKNRVE